MRRRFQILFSEPSKCDPSQASDCDINNIIKRYPDGTSPFLMSSPGSVDPMNLSFGDTTLFPDYQTALDLVDKVEETFFSLPSNVRAAFNNNPEEFVQQLSSNEFREKFEKLNLIKKLPQNADKIAEVSSQKTNELDSEVSDSGNVT